MFRIKFKPADYTRRTPAWLQSHTKENIIWQFAMTVLFVGGMIAKDAYEERELRKERENRIREIPTN